MSKNDKQQQSNGGALASQSRCVQKVLDTQRRFIDDFMTHRCVVTSQIQTDRYRDVVLTSWHKLSCATNRTDPTPRRTKLMTHRCVVTSHLQTDRYRDVVLTSCHTDAW